MTYSSETHFIGIPVIYKEHIQYCVFSIFHETCSGRFFFVLLRELQIVSVNILFDYVCGLSIQQRFSYSSSCNLFSLFLFLLYTYSNNPLIEIFFSVTSVTVVAVVVVVAAFVAFFFLLYIKYLLCSV